MKFFTDHTVDNMYLLIPIKKYKRMKDFSRWKEVLVDPGVYELKKKPFYSWEGDINISDFLDTLPGNHYFSADYPCDMNPAYTDTFLMKSWDNAVKYCAHPNYIVTVQSKLNRYDSFVEWFDRYNELPNASGILGIGNTCRILKHNEFIKHMIPYAFKHSICRRIHIYGLAMVNIPFTYKMAKKYGIELSIDSTKWTRACSTKLKKKYPGKWNCLKHNRQEFFDEYKKLMKSKGISLTNDLKPVGLQNDYVDK